MPRTSPFHAPEEDAYHDHSECMLAAEVRADQRREGDGGKAQCALCRALNRAEELARP